MGTQHRIITGDSRNMADVSDKSVHLIVTSPPYWQLKDYGTEDQIGFHDSYESYINNLNLVWKECHRVLHDGCRLCVNIGDQFARAVYYGRYKVIPIREEIIKFCETIGFDYMGAIIWQKVTWSNSSGGGVQMGSYPFPRNGIVKLDYEFILIFKKPGNAPKPTAEQKERSRMTPEGGTHNFNGHWYFNGAKQDKHLAMFPEELPTRLIKMFSFEGETVLDPFMGSGTTALAAKNLCRNSVGYEINGDFLQGIVNKVGAPVEFSQSCARVVDFDKEISGLPYIFKDPHALNKKIDVKKLNFGSKIGAGDKKREDYFTVKEVISPELVRLNNDLVVRLIGIKQDPAINGAATAFLRDKLKGKRVFLRHDAVKYDSNNNLMAYLYLENKTFVNAHLLKAGTAGVDNSLTFKYLNKFQSINL